MASKLDADDFVNVWMDGEPRPAAGPGGTNKSIAKSDNEFFDKWHAQSSGKLSIPQVTGAEALRNIYPNHSLVMTQGFNLSIMSFPGATFTPIEKTPLVTNLLFIPLARNLGSVPGILIDNIEFGAFNVSWKSYEYIMYVISYPVTYGSITQYFILHEGPEDASRLFLLSAGAYADALHDEIWVFDQGGFWRKNHNLWVEAQKANWDDVILAEEFKTALKKDVYGFFESQELYKELSIPWKRGLIMYGPPGNGKTISLKAIMKECSALGYAPLYVKTFKTWRGEEGSMDEVFSKARQLAPCVLILEDLDSLINDFNRSFFLNQLDGLESNDGMLIIGTTNHFERLDPGISTRPSRFDRKFNFEDPNEHERILYAQYWQKKLASNKDVDFSDPLVTRIAQSTDKFSFAYLKEAFVSSLVTLIGIEGAKPTFESVIMNQIDTLRKQLDKQSVGSRRARFEARLEEPDRDDGCYYPTAVDRADAWQHGHEHEHGARGYGRSHGHRHGHGRHGRKDAAAASTRSRDEPPRPYANTFIDDEMRNLLDTRVDAARTRLYRAQFGADSVLRGPRGPGQGVTSGSSLNDVHDLLGPLSDSIAAECNPSASQRRFYDGALPAVQPLAGSSRLNLNLDLDAGCSAGPAGDFAIMEHHPSAQWARGQGGVTAGLAPGLPSGW
ncbi:hypothetical protein D9619_000646 [Psilocybe cf. subviscida]|uniref:AAA+ ATPase domain-containing protein n=1 Tax=Psilocybe cf. subviscida TaxID=2480587 RepID=A0A8H5BFV6_9AGAR|nr:hypothetical protein D9619_000646 [Psilocybe cf. subviscida]